MRTREELQKLLADVSLINDRMVAWSERTDRCFIHPLHLQQIAMLNGQLIGIKSALEYAIGEQGLPKSTISAPDGLSDWVPIDQIAGAFDEFIDGLYEIYG